MKKRWFVFILFIFSVMTLWSQNPYYDAMSLSTLKTQLKDGKVGFRLSDTVALCKVLSKYAPDQKFYPGLVLAFRDNPFITLPMDASMAGKSTQDISGYNKSFEPLGYLGGIDVTNLADGLARFMVQRAKEELSVAFFQRFKDDLENKYPELRVVFPETYILLMTIDKDIYRFNIYLSAMREAFQHDLSNLYFTFPNLLNLEKYKKYFDANPELRALLASSLYIINGLTSGKHPGKVLEDFPVKELGELKINNLSPAIRTLGLLSKSLKSKSGDHYWIKPDSLKLMFLDGNLQTFRIFLGLVYHQSGGIIFSNGDSLKGILAKIAKPAESVGQYKMFITRLVERTDVIQVYLDEFLNSRKSEINYNNYYRYFNAVIDLVELTGALNDLPGMGFMPEKTDRNFSKYIFVARRAGDVYLNVNQTNYTVAILNVQSIYDTLFYKSPVSDSYSGFKPQLLKYGVFMAGVANAQSSDEVKAVLESTVMPAGSSLIKSYSKCHFSVNSYLGGFAGHEWIKGVSDSCLINTAGISAPIGIAFSKGIGKTKPWKPIGAISAFISVIDIGALASYRFGDDSTSNIPEIKLENIFAPGIFLVFGRLANSPLAFGVGYQYGPQMRKVTTDGIETVMNTSRFTAFLAVDIPLFNLYAKPKY